MLVLGNHRPNNSSYFAALHVEKTLAQAQLWRLPHQMFMPCLLCHASRSLETCRDESALLEHDALLSSTCRSQAASWHTLSSGEALWLMAAHSTRLVPGSSLGEGLDLSSTAPAWHGGEQNSSWKSCQDTVGA